MNKLLFVFSLVVLSPVFMPPALAHDGCHGCSPVAEDREEEIVRQFHRNFLKLVDGEEPHRPSLPSQIFVTVGGQKYFLNEYFFNLLALALDSVADDHNEFCKPCIIEEAKKFVAHPEKRSFLEKRAQNFWGFYASGAAWKREFGRYAVVGYLLMEAGEHTVLGPFGVCPILNAAYLNMLKTIKRSQNVFWNSRHFRLLPIPSAYSALKAGILSLRFHRALKTLGIQHEPLCRTNIDNAPIFENESGAARFYKIVYGGRVARSLRYLGAKLRGEEPPDLEEHSVTKKDYNRLGRQLGRRKWLSWTNWMQSTLSTRSTWGLAYAGLYLNPLLEGRPEIEDGFETGSKPPSWIEEIHFIYDRDKPTRERFFKAHLLSEGLQVQAEFLKYYLRQAFRDKYLKKDDFLRGRRAVSEWQKLLRDYSDHLVAASLSRRERSLSAWRVGSLNGLQAHIDILHLSGRWSQVDNELRHKIEDRARNLVHSSATRTPEDARLLALALEEQLGQRSLQIAHQEKLYEFAQSIDRLKERSPWRIKNAELDKILFRVKCEGALVSD